MCHILKSILHTLKAKVRSSVEIREPCGIKETWKSRERCFRAGVRTSSLNLTTQAEWQILLSLSAISLSQHEEEDNLHKKVLSSRHVKCYFCFPEFKEKSGIFKVLILFNIQMHLHCIYSVSCTYTCMFLPFQTCFFLIFLDFANI